MSIVRVVDSITGETSIIDLREDNERESRTVADILSQEIDAEDAEYYEVEMEELEGEEPSDEQNTDEETPTGVRFVAICIDSACVTHDMDFTENDDLREAVRDWTNDQANRVSLIWQRPSTDQGWELIETITSVGQNTETVVE